ncbi:hypothetical protein CVT26_011007 [Gymnopilus dilepis]|uniref:Uncharacterized protein n=1 Tax=Gymnopilus dilepis TaxID=231916 RepID=A0A409VYA1_9AGAR|nr:hypothetical protein CVT26_011007 [Gymnopilus dilepis]
MSYGYCANCLPPPIPPPWFTLQAAHRFCPEYVAKQEFLHVPKMRHEEFSGSFKSGAIHITKDVIYHITREHRFSGVQSTVYCKHLKNDQIIHISSRIVVKQDNDSMVSYFAAYPIKADDEFVYIFTPSYALLNDSCRALRHDDPAWPYLILVVPKENTNMDFNSQIGIQYEEFLPPPPSPPNDISFVSDKEYVNVDRSQAHAHQLYPLGIFPPMMAPEHFSTPITQPPLQVAARKIAAIYHAHKQGILPSVSPYMTLTSPSVPSNRRTTTTIATPHILSSNKRDQTGNLLYSSDASNEIKGPSTNSHPPRKRARVDHLQHELNDACELSQGASRPLMLHNTHTPSPLRIEHRTPELASSDTFNTRTQQTRSTSQTIIQSHCPDPAQPSHATPSSTHLTNTLSPHTVLYSDADAHHFGTLSQLSIAQPTDTRDQCTRYMDSLPTFPGPSGL